MALHFCLAHLLQKGTPKLELRRTFVDALSTLLDAAQQLRQPPQTAFAAVRREARVRFPHGGRNVTPARANGIWADLGLRDSLALQGSGGATEVPIAAVVSGGKVD